MIKCLKIFVLLLFAARAQGQHIAATDYSRFFPKASCDKRAFRLAVKGYNILRNQSLLLNPRYLTIVDFTQPSNRRRFFVLDLQHRRVAIASTTAHGIGSDPDSCTIPYRFSNFNGSKASSVGFYITGDTYFNHRPGDSLGLCLFGLDQGYNDSAAVREIVIHYGATEYSGREYVTDAGAARSNGCPALPLSTNSQVVGLIKGGSCLFIYSARAKDYQKKSTVLNRKLEGAIFQQGPPPNNCTCNLIPRDTKSPHPTGN